jgi:L-aspartate oxidase
VALPAAGWAAPGAAPGGEDAPAARDAEAGGAGRLALARAMSRYAGVMRDGAGLGRLLRVIAGTDAAAGAAGRAPAVHGAVRVEQALVLDDGELAAVEAANLRTVSLLIAAGARRRAESRGCHRRRDATGTAAAPWHTLARWDGQRLVISEETL